MHLTIARPLTDLELLATARATFPGPGKYDILAKAGEPEAEGAEFSEWFLRELARSVDGNFISAQLAIWETLDRLLVRRGVQAPSQLAAWELHRALFTLSGAATARMIGVAIPEDVRVQLTALGFSPFEVIDFPMWAYRVGMIYQRLARMNPAPWSEVMRLARAVPLSSADRAAIDYARNRAGVYLKPVFDASGQIWAADREIAPLRAATVEAIRTRAGAKELARELEKSQRAQGVIRDARRTARTELAEARCQGSWSVDSKRWGNAELLFRQTSSRACKGCLRLFRNPDGTPRTFTRAQLEAEDALGPNRGDWREYHLRVGIIHVQCLCSPVQRWLPAMASIFAQRAPEYAATMKELKVFEAQAA